MIKVYSLQKGIPILNAKFSEQYLRDNGIVSTDHILSADLFLTQSTKLKSYKIINTIFPFKKRIVWTNEPRYNQTTDNFITDNQAIMNVYSGDVFLHNLHFLGSYHNDFSVDLGIDIKNPPDKALTLRKLQEKKKFCIAVFSYRNPQTSKLIVNGKDIDLYTLRQDMASYFFEKNKTDIVGGKWPSNIKTHESSGFESGNQHWWVRKLDLLKDYKFNICLENTIYPNYCTEKIWHAIMSGCLPIYYCQGTNIYQTFPENSIVDASAFNSFEELLHFLEHLPPEEHLERYNACLKAMQQACSERLANPHLKTDILDQFIKNIKLLTGKN